MAVISFQVAVAQTNEGQRTFADLQKKYEPQRQQLKSLGDEINSLTRQLQAQATTLSPADQQSRSTAIETKKKQLDHDTQDAQNEFQKDMQNVYNVLASKVYDVMKIYAEEHGYLMVFDVSQHQENPVIFASESVNITKAVTEAYNAKPVVPAAASAAAPSRSGQGTTITTNCTGVKSGPNGEIIPTNCTTQ